MTLVILALSACEEPTTPTQAASIRIIRSPERTDTIEAFFRDSLIIEVSGEDGLPAANTRVDFGNGPGTPGAGVETIFTTQYTDPAGRVRGKVRAGVVAGTRWLTFHVPVFGVVDSLEFTMRPGAPAEVSLTPDRVLLAVGGTQAFTAKALDRRGNVLPEVPTLIPFGEITVSGAVVTARQPGNYLLEARLGTIKAIAAVDIVPIGRVAHVSEGQLVVRNFDGSGRTVLTAGAGSPVWLPDGSVLAVAASALIRVVPGGTPTLFLSGPPGDLRDFAQPSVSPDGVWVYFLASTVSDPERKLYRASVNGTGAEQLEMPEPIQQYSFSPDPQVLAYHTGARAPGRVYNRATGAFFDFPPFQHFPWWSPQGDLIAFGTGDLRGLHIFTATGQFVRTLHPTWYFESFRLSWSQNGRFILGNTGSIMRLVDLENGSLIELPFIGEIGASIRIP